MVHKCSEISPASRVVEIQTQIDAFEPVNGLTELEQVTTFRGQTVSLRSRRLRPVSLYNPPLNFVPSWALRMTIYRTQG